MEEELKIIEELVSKSNKNSEDYDVLEELNQSIGTYYLDNDIITIEYHSPLEKYRAIKLLEILEKHKDFYKFFLSEKEKIVFSKSLSSDDKVLVIESNSFELGVNEYNFINLLFGKKIVNGHPIASDICDKLSGKSTSVSKEVKLGLLRQRLLKDLRDKGLIDFFDYLDVMDGSFFNERFHLEKIIVDYAFEKGYFGFLKRMLDDGKLDLIKDSVYVYLFEECALDLFNEQLEFQSKLVNKDGKRAFLAKNMCQVVSFFNSCIGDVMSKYQNIKPKESKKLSREEIISEVVFILKDIDSSGELLKEFEDNIANGKIIMWDSKDTEKRKQMYQKYHMAFNIDEPMCFYTYRGDDITGYVVNIPLYLSISDVPTIVHEMMHFHSLLKNKKKNKNDDLVEFSSIYFEEHAKNLLMKKGYTREELCSPRFNRVVSAFRSYQLVSPTIGWLDIYLKNGTFDFKAIEEIVKARWYQIVEYCISQNFSKERIGDSLIKFGFLPNIDDSTLHVIKNLAISLVIYNKSIFDGYPYVLGTILAYYAMEHNIDKKVIFDICSRFNTIDDVYGVLKELGIDMEKYGFVDLKDDDSRGGGRDKR